MVEATQNQTAVWCRAKLIAAISVTLITVLSSGCATHGNFYAGIGAGKTLKKDILLNLNEDQYGSDPTAHIALGHEWKWDKRWQAHCELNHWSHFRDGGPFNSNPETYKDEIVCGGRVNFGHWGQ